MSMRSGDAIEGPEVWSSPRCCSSPSPNDSTAVELILDAGADPNHHPDKSAPPLFRAVYKFELVPRLIAAGADLHALHRGQSITMHAGRWGAERIQRLVELGARYTAADAIVADDLEGATWLLEPPLHPQIAGFCVAKCHRAKPERRDQWLLLLTRLAEAGADMQPARHAARSLHAAELIRAAIERGADPDAAVTQDGRSGRELAGKWIKLQDAMGPRP